MRINTAKIRVQHKRNGAGVIFYVACEPDSHGAYKQYSAEEVEKAPIGKFEVRESATAASIARETFREHSPLGAGWVKVPIRDSRHREPVNMTQRLANAFEKLGLPKSEAALAARGPMQDIDIQLRGRELTDRLGHDLMDVER